MTKVVFEEKYYPAVKEMVYRTRLANGLTVALLPKKEFKEVYGSVTVQFGSIDTLVTEVDGDVKQYPGGIAHFLEHKLFEREDSSDLMSAFTSLGADSNAFTSFTKTNYLFSATDYFLENLYLLDELVTSAHFTEASILTEQDIIQQEREMYQDDPDSCLFFSTLANLYPGTPLATDIVGSEESISQINLTNLQENFTKFYKPVNMSLFLVGNFDVERVQDYFESKELKDSDFQEVAREKLFLQPVKPTDSMRMEVSSPKLAIGVRGKREVSEADCYRHHILLKLLFAMMFGWTSDRFQKCYESGKIDASLSLEVEVTSRFHFVMLTMDTKEPVALSHQFRKAIRNFTKDLDITEEHLDIIKREMFGEFFSSMNSLEFIATQYDAFENGETIFDLPKILQEITLEDVLDAGHHLIDDGDIVDFTIFPS
ncbi:putative protease [Streptococcus pneumoniae]|uniref:EF-P 5-aminopentanol modification-associated protein YfmH n=2 Tax=Streptococcus pneumoniae TaxID=1313 RepID=UPI000152F3D2|nr:pitrilysin family protein [Streptococcus pneumoniae]EDK70171.1 peptidase, M16 family protein [Streptococcus pneumoniae SP19-BS75]EHD26090.1 insulinase family protein [Streptococcus pneumoniae 4027-06]EHD30845.1 insulinase family protein [Streptococcus pneumoniae 6735-05]EHD40185.1 insulinase family protein [Streptococcus pneumoniae GA43265]EHD48316.1 insulinase family protein [Streptococcus pneumoniae 6901-05]EHD54820.1 insulinase family protein [Streptococcus pneumoniae GA44500]EHD64133.